MLVCRLYKGLKSSVAICSLKFSNLKRITTAHAVYRILAITVTERVCHVIIIMRRGLHHNSQVVFDVSYAPTRQA